MKAGWSRGVIELRQSLTNAGDLFNHAFWPVLMLITLFFMRHTHFGSTGLLPSILGMNASMAMMTMSQQLTAVRCGLRAEQRSVLPVGKIISVSGGLVIDLAIFLIPGLFLVSGLAVSWDVLWILALGLLATLPLGAVLGSLFTSARSQGLLTLPVLALIAISGIFYPITAMPAWLQGIAQVFPIYWMGLGMRSALLPDAAVTVEIGQSWRHLETIAVLGTWAVLGLLVAPIVLRHMARRESGSTVSARRERALQRVG